MRYGFAIDQRTCIGCHACTVACKTEHDVPLGQFRTWVKYVEKGDFPATTREFGVMRCNHCADAPCIAICPTNALFRRDDGIVDFDSDSCIGCKSCIQACPYDAIYIDAEGHTAAKCNFCAHRIDQGLEPACVVVCPTESIWVGDLDDPASRLSQMVATTDVAVRAPEQNTNPSLFYIGADPVVLDPLAAPVGDTYLWAEPDPHRRAAAPDLRREDPAGTATAPVPVDATAPAPPLDTAPPGPATDGAAGTAAYTSLNTAHPPAWGWRVYGYLWTKAVGGGALLVAAVALLLGIDLGPVGDVVAPALGFGFTAATGALLIADLKRPARFLYLFLRPNPTSWLVWGGLILAAYSGLALLWLAGGLFGVPALIGWVAAPAALGGAATAGYTAFLFGQAEARDLWQSRLLLWHLLVQAVMVGAGALLVASWVRPVDATAQRFLTVVLLTGVVGHLAMLAAEYARRHPTRNATAAARMVVRGRYARLFWAAGVGLCVLTAGLAGSGLLAGGPAVLTGLAGLLIQPALLAYEAVFVRAAQDVPLS